MSGTSAFRRRLAAAVAAAALSAAALTGCSAASAASASSGAATSATTVSPSSSTSASSATNRSITVKTAASSNTQLTAGTWTGTIGGQSVTLKGAYVVDGINATIDGGTYASTTADQAVFLVVNGGHLTVSNAGIAKSGSPADAEGDDYNFYGLNSAIVVVGSSSSATIANSTVSTTSNGSNAIFATDSAKITVDTIAVDTTGDSSRGLDATYAGTITASNVAIHTRGAHCATLATDRGNGTVTVTGTNTLITEGDGSPLLYSTGAISASGVTGTSKASEAVVVEGKNQATLTDSTVTTGGTNAIMLYQSFSGDAPDASASAAQSTFTMSGVKLTHTGSGAVVYATNTTTVATLTKSTVTTSGGTAVKAAEDRWGTSGSNGGKLTVNLVGTTLSGASASGSSSITVKATNGGSLTGATSGTVTVG